MQLIEAPNKAKALIGYPSVFLAGGITNCPDWQTEVIKAFKGERITIYNPRRANFPMNDPSAAKEQIEWEYNMLRVCNLASFWFSVGSLNPIVLFELGATLERDNQKIVVGCHPGYERIADVQVQTALRQPDIHIKFLLSHLVGAIRHKLVLS